MKHRRFSLVFGALGVVLALAACQSNEPTSKVSDVKEGQLQPPPAKIQESELRAYCPAVSLREGTAVLRKYAKGGEGDPQKLVYQASVTDVTRSCSRDQTNMTINIAAAGRVVPGPAGGSGPVTLPVRVVVLRGGDSVVYSKLHQQQVNIPNPAVATQYLFSDPAVVIPLPEPGTIQIFVGFDEGPPARGKK